MLKRVFVMLGRCSTWRVVENWAGDETRKDRRGDLVGDDHLCTLDVR